MRLIKAGLTSRSIYISADDSSSTTGGKLTGLAYNTAGLTAYYFRPGGSATAITLVDLASAGAAYSSGGFKEISAVNMPGLYRLDLPDAVLATGVDSALVCIKGATNLVPITLLVQLTDHTQFDVNVRAFNGVDLQGVGAIPELGILDQGTAQSATVNGVQLRSAAPFPDNALIGATIGVFGSTQGYWQFATVAGNVGSTDQTTFQVPLTVTPTGTVTYKVFGTALVNTATDWTATELQQIRNRLGIDGTQATPAASPTLASAAALQSLANVAADIPFVKAKTDQLTFTQTGHVDANIQRINDVLVTGSGNTGTPWGS